MFRLNQETFLYCSWYTSAGETVTLKKKIHVADVFGERVYFKITSWAANAGSKAGTGATSFPGGGKSAGSTSGTGANPLVREVHFVVQQERLFVVASIGGTGTRYR